MSDANPPYSRVQQALELATILLVSLCGLASGALWPAAGGAAVALLFISDRGQHRALVDRVHNLSPAYVAALSVGAHLISNLLFCLLAFCAGRLSGLFWFDLSDRHDGVWSEIATWSAFTLSVVAVMRTSWWLLGRASR